MSTVIFPVSLVYYQYGASSGVGPTRGTLIVSFIVHMNGLSLMKVGASVGSVIMMSTFLFVGTAFAQTANTMPPKGGFDGAGQRAPGVFGTVASITGNTITVTSKGFGSNATVTSYTVDATNATVTKAGAVSTVSAIAVGDTVMAEGTVSGTNVTATKINDGVMQGVGGKKTGGPGMRGAASSTAPRGEMRGSVGANITGNGEPVIGGTVASISGTSLTITNKSNVTYSVDATNATVNKSGATSTVSAIAAGDAVIVQGTVNGTAVVASSVIDQGVAPTASPSATPTTSGSGDHGGFFGNFLGSIGGFFQRLFGF